MQTQSALSPIKDFPGFPVRLPTSLEEGSMPTHGINSVERNNPFPQLKHHSTEIIESTKLVTSTYYIKNLPIKASHKLSTTRSSSFPNFTKLLWPAGQEQKNRLASQCNHFMKQSIFIIIIEYKELTARGAETSLPPLN